MSIPLHEIAPSCFNCGSGNIKTTTETTNQFEDMKVDVLVEGGEVPIPPKSYREITHLLVCQDCQAEHSYKIILIAEAEHCKHTWVPILLLGRVIPSLWYCTKCGATK